MVSGKWRREPYPPRSYESLTNYVPASLTTSVGGLLSVKTDGNPSNNATTELDLLNTTLDGYLGQPYNYNDGELTEEWMMTFKDVVTDTVNPLVDAVPSGSTASKSSRSSNGGSKKLKSVKKMESILKQPGVSTIQATVDDIIRLQIENLLEILKIQVCKLLFCTFQW